MPRSPAHRHRSRRGIALALVFAIVLTITFFSAAWFFLVRGEAAASDLLAKRLAATATGEAVAAEVSALVHRQRWDRRFHRRIGTEVSPGSNRWQWVFDDTELPLIGDPAVSLGPLGRMSWERPERPRFRGLVKDLPRAKSYRILVSVTFAEVQVFMTWDKEWSQGLMGRMVAANDIVATRVEAPGDTGADERLDAVRRRARENSGPDAKIRDQLDELVEALQAGRKPEIVLAP
jgi:hypothetical protein